MVASGPRRPRIISYLVANGVPGPRTKVSEGVSNLRATHDGFGVAGETKDRRFVIGISRRDSELCGHIGSY